MAAAFNQTLFQQTIGLLRNSDPQTFERFMRLLDAHVFEVTVAVTNAPAAEILQAQGRAQEAQKMMQFFTDAIEPNRATP